MTKKQLKIKLETSLDNLYKVKRNYDYQKATACVNVKRYNDYEDIKKVIEEYTQDKLLRKKLEGLYTKDYIYQTYNTWLEDEASYFLDDYVNQQCCNSSREYWQTQIIDKESNPKNKKQLIKDMEKDLKEARLLKIVSTMGCGFYGRNGGWFGVDITELIDDIENILGELKDCKYKEVLEHYYIADILEQIEAVFYVLDKADKYNKGMIWKDFLLEEMDYHASNLKEEIIKEKQLKIAKRYAEINGYILAKGY